MKELADMWLSDAETLAKYGDERGALLLRQVAKDLRIQIEESERRTVNLRQASRLTGLHEDSIGRLVRQGKVTNHGTPNRPRVRVADLPRKPNAIAPDASSGDFSQEVFRGIVTSKFGGH